MKEQLISEIIELLYKCEDLAIVDLIHQLLAKSVDNNFDGS